MCQSFVVTDQSHNPLRYLLTVSPYLNKPLSHRVRIELETHAPASCPRCGNQQSFMLGLSAGYMTGLMNWTAHGAEARLCREHNVLMHCLIPSNAARHRQQVHQWHASTVQSYNTTIRCYFRTRCYFNVQWKADTSQLNLLHGTNN